MCIFTGIHSTSDGGAVYFYQNTKNAKIEESFFNDCNTTGSGGGLYSWSKNGYLHRNCFSLCSGANYHAFYFEVNSADSINSIEYVSVYRCPQTLKSGDYIVDQYNGVITNQHGNMSNSRISASYNWLCSYMRTGSKIQMNTLYSNHGNSLFRV
jgi:hypothetical protein